MRMYGSTNPAMHLPMAHKKGPLQVNIAAIPLAVFALMRRQRSSFRSIELATARPPSVFG